MADVLPMAHHSSQGRTTAADILKGQSDTTGSAPLSQAQTVAICRHLQTEIREVEADTDETKRYLQHTTNHLQKLREQHDTREDQIHTLQTAISNSNAHMSKVETEVQRLFEAVLQLQMSDQNKME